MKQKSVFVYVWKITLCSIAFLLGIILSGLIIPKLGFHAPEIPLGADPNTIIKYYFFSSPMLAFALFLISRNLGAHWYSKWFILFSFTWVFIAIGMVIEACFFMITGAVSSVESSVFTILNFLLPSLLVAGSVSILFKPSIPKIHENTWRKYFSKCKPTEWGLRISLSLMAFPLVYFLFGLLVKPLIQAFYSNSQYELVIPTWRQLIPLQLTRSLIFFMATMPIIVYWRNSRVRLILTLGFSIFLLTAYMAVITSYWFPWQLRLYQGLELFVDGLAYSTLIVNLIKPLDEKTRKMQLSTLSKEDE